MRLLEILQIAGLGIIAVILAVMLKAQKPELALQLSIITGVVIFMMIAGKLSAVIDLLGSYSKRVDLDPIYFETVLKIIGIAYITEFGAEVCKDAGESSIASKIELAGRVVIVALAVPIITSLLDLIINIMP